MRAGSVCENVPGEMLGRREGCGPDGEAMPGGADRNACDRMISEIIREYGKGYAGYVVCITGNVWPGG